MKFGKVVEESSLKKINFSLPPDNEITIETFKKVISKKNSGQNLYIGCSVWADPGFKGKLYPNKTPQKDYLKIYSENFNSIELNSTFYGTPSKERVLKWKNQVNSKFKFCPKVTKSISHRKNIDEQKSRLDDFFDSVCHFDNNLGPIFMQLPPYFSPKNIDQLKKFLEFIPKEFIFAIELRHPEWFKNNFSEEIFSYFKEKKVIPIITDTAGRRDVLHSTITSDITFIRFVGNNLHPSDLVRIDQWIEKIIKWFKKGIQDVFFMLHQPEKGNSIDLASYMLKAFIQKTKSDNINYL